MSVYINSRAAGIKRDKIFRINHIQQLIIHLGLDQTINHNGINQKQKSNKRSDSQKQTQSNNNSENKSDSQPFIINLTKLQTPDGYEALNSQLDTKPNPIK